MLLHIYSQLFSYIFIKYHKNFQSTVYNYSYPAIANCFFLSPFTLIKDFGDDYLHTPKKDNVNSKKIARYTLDHWAKLKQYGSIDKKHNQLKTMNRQFGFYMGQKTTMKSNLIALLDQTIQVQMTSLTALPATTAAKNG